MFFLLSVVSEPWVTSLSCGVGHPVLAPSVKVATLEECKPDVRRYVGKDKPCNKFMAPLAVSPHLVCISCRSGSASAEGDDSARAKLFGHTRSFRTATRVRKFTTSHQHPILVLGNWNLSPPKGSSPSPAAS